MEYSIFSFQFYDKHFHFFFSLERRFGDVRWFKAHVMNVVIIARFLSRYVFRVYLYIVCRSLTLLRLSTCFRLLYNHYFGFLRHFAQSVVLRCDFFLKIFVNLFRILFLIHLFFGFCKKIGFRVGGGRMRQAYLKKKG